MAGSFRCVTMRTMRRDATQSANRRARWQRIIREAAEQSERSILPELGEPVSLEEALDHAPRPMVLAWEQEVERSVRSAFDGLSESCPIQQEMSAFVGPVGGFDSGEIELARSRGAVTVSLGRRVLRAETAAIVLVTAIMHELGELGPTLLLLDADRRRSDDSFNASSIYSGRGSRPMRSRTA